MSASGVTRRRLCALALGSALLAACGGEDETESLPKTGTSDGKVVYSTWGAPDRREAENWTLLAFEKNYTDLKVDVVWAPTISEYIAKQHALLAGGTPPDVLRLPSWSAGTFYYEEAVRRLDPLIRRDSFKTEHLAPPFDVATYKRSLHALPRGQSGVWVVFCNLRALQEAGLKVPAAGWAWDDFLSTARATTRPAGSGPAQWGTAIEPIVDFYYPWLWGHGVDELDRSGEKSNLTDPGVREALQWIADLRLKHKVAPPAGELPAGAAAFASGRVAMWYGPADTELELTRAGAPDFTIVPQPKGKSGQQAGYKPDVIALSAVSQNVNDAWELLQFLVDVDTQRLELDNGLWLPQAKTITATDAYRTTPGPPHDRRPGTPGVGLRARTPVILPRADDMRSAVFKELAPFWQGSRPIKDATEAAASATNAVLNGEA